MARVDQPYLVKHAEGTKLVSPFWVTDGAVAEPTPLGRRVIAVFAPVRDKLVDSGVFVLYWGLVGFLFLASLVYRRSIK